MSCIVSVMVLMISNESFLTKWISNPNVGSAQDKSVSWGKQAVSILKCMR